jgi:Beta-ketoacyl synthase, C-terminal domain/Ketoacyl-synthetase C-terminal extension
MQHLFSQRKRLRARRGYRRYLPKALGGRDSGRQPRPAVVTGSAANHKGHTSTVSQPSSQGQEALIRQAYRNAGITDIARTGFFECHGTGTRTGDPIETAAESACFGKAGVHIGSVKANLGHAGGAAGLVGVLKAVLALENRTIPPNIKSLPRNPAIPFEDANLIVPTEPTPWPEDRDERVSVDSFGLGGSNAHAIIGSAASVSSASHHTTDTPGQNTAPARFRLGTKQTPCVIALLRRRICRVKLPASVGTIPCAVRASTMATILRVLKKSRRQRPAHEVLAHKSATIGMETSTSTTFTLSY